MELIILDDPRSVAVEAARRIQRLVNTEPSANVGLATGGTPQGIYHLLIEAYQRGEASFARNRFFMLDEYMGVPSTSSTSFQHVLESNFLDHVNVQEHALEILDGNASDMGRECSRFEGALTDAGGIDLQLLGIGTNGHIGFNEPGSSFESRTRVVELHPQTLRSNSRYFDSIDQVPRNAVTQGLGTLINAKSILLIATGSSKAPALAAMFSSSPSPDCPASILQKHSGATIIVDTAAAALISLDNAQKALSAQNS